MKLRNNLAKQFLSGFIASLLIVFILGGNCLGAPSLELYGTFHAMGIIVTIDADADPDHNATTMVQYREGKQAFREGFPLTRVSDTRFVGSLFWLNPGKSYDVQVTILDPGSVLDGLVLSAAANTRNEIVIPEPTKSLYVSPDGNGTACLPEEPCSLSEAIDQAMPGDEIVLGAGIYYVGNIYLPRSGREHAPIVIRSAPGVEAILDGSDPNYFHWTDIGSGIWHTEVNVSNTHLVCADGHRLYPYGSMEDLNTLKWGISGFFSSGTDLYVKFTDNTDPNQVTMIVSRHNHAFYIERDWIYLVNLTFRYYGQGSYAKAIYFNNASNNLIQGCTFAVNDLGIGIKRESHRNVIQDCNFYDTIFNWPWDSVKSGSRLETGGIRFYDPMTGRGTVIRRNVFHDFFDGFGVCPASTAGVTNETDVYENLVYQVGDDGIETDGQASNVRIWKNTFHDVLMGISLAPVYTGPVYAIRNLIYNTGVGNNNYSGSPFKFNSGYAKSGCMYLFHNTCHAGLPGNNGIYIKAPGSWENIISRNNIWAGTNYALNDYNTSQPIDFDYDDLYTSNPDEFIYWGEGPNRHIHDLETFRSITGQEQHGLNVEPEFNNIDAGDYGLKSDSKLIDAGTTIPGINDDFSGNAPDIGAFERKCIFDGDGDGDVDGIDLATFALEATENFRAFAQEFGRSDCI